jgi:hypothetical protein
MRRRPIGQILIEKNEITEEDLAAALAEQERSGRRLGEILIESGRISWLALARAMAEQVLDIDGKQSEPSTSVAEPPTPEGEAVAPVPLPKPAPASTKDLPSPELLVRAMAQQVLEHHAAATPKPAWSAKPRPVAPAPLEDPETKLESVEALLRERQRAFIELFTTAETLRMKVARLEEILDERDRELTRLRVVRAS